MAQLLDAPLVAVSIPNQGSMFGLVMPESYLVAHSEVISKHAISPALFDNKLVLIVDDEAEIRDSLKELLQSWHCKVIAAASCNEAVDALSDGELIPDIVLADYRLRDSETGIDVIRKIQSLYTAQAIPAIIITGDTAPDRIKEANASGYKILHKPVSPDELRSVLADILF
jgi:CheY-like chemotaxis protein